MFMQGSAAVAVVAPFVAPVAPVALVDAFGRVCRFSLSAWRDRM